MCFVCLSVCLCVPVCILVVFNSSIKVGNCELMSVRCRKFDVIIDVKSREWKTFLLRRSDL